MTQSLSFDEHFTRCQELAKPCPQTVGRMAWILNSEVEQPLEALVVGNCVTYIHVVYTFIRKVLIGQNIDFIGAFGLKLKMSFLANFEL